MPTLPLSLRGAVLLLAGCLAYTTAPAAHADDNTFLDLLKDDQSLASFSPSALLQEAQKVCAMKNQPGMSEAQAVSMVQTDLGLPNNASDAAFDIVDAASAGFGC